MPQLTLRISKNIDMSQVNFRELFVAIHAALREVPNLDVTTCHSGVVQEDFSYVGLGDERVTKMFLEVYWLESAQRSAMKSKFAQRLMNLLEEMMVPQIEKQSLICIPRVRIADLGVLDQDYLISKRASTGEVQ